MGMV
jgi:hypothetical protein